MIICYSNLPPINDSSKSHSHGFSQLEDEISEDSQCALIISYDHLTSSIFIERTAHIPDIDSSHSSNSISLSDIIANLYLTASSQYVTFLAASTATTMQDSSICSPSYLSSDTQYPTLAVSKKKYKPVALKVCLVITDLPD